jgi:zinc/manganese transport system substrate-binding protein
MTKTRFLAIPLLAATALLGLTACGGDTVSTPSSAAASAADAVRIVVTYPVLGAVVSEVVGDAADVTVLMPNGADPHEWSPSAQDIETMQQADLIIDNGLGLEGNLQDALTAAKSSGVSVFTVSDNIAIRKVKAGEGAELDDPDQAPGAEDPHLWMDPLTMKQWVGPLVPALAAVGVDASANAATVQAELDALNLEVAGILDTVPADRRKLVTGHESLGYLAERYGYELVGAVIPAITSQAQASAGDLAALVAKIEVAGVPAIFTEIGTPAATVEAIGNDTGATVVELSTHTLPADGSYHSFMIDVSTKIADALR